ncbi:hypothetical protein PR001_g32850 [Phytophthora rubi]|uniref:Uncharacterized protein n=1 Tax=Phytophthora rubi TaxID=129364 RepID=A0A6A3G989_9STRA|nr:hypothetical protein PR001_g32850 [Phytophthora rubi]
MAAKASRDLDLEVIFSREERVRFIRKTKRVLFIAEYLVLAYTNLFYFTCTTEPTTLR